MYEVVGLKRLNYEKKDKSTVKGYVIACIDLDPEITAEQPVWGTPVESFYIKDEALSRNDNKELFQALASVDKFIGRHFKPLFNRFGGFDGVIFTD